MAINIKFYASSKRGSAIIAAVLVLLFYLLSLLWSYYFLCCLADGDSCDTNHCENNGTCVDGIRTFKCLCLDGYSGKNCEKGRNDAEQNRQRASFGVVRRGRRWTASTPLLCRQ